MIIQWCREVLTKTHPYDLSLISVPEAPPNPIPSCIYYVGQSSVIKSTIHMAHHIYLVHSPRLNIEYAVHLAPLTGISWKQSVVTRLTLSTSRIDIITIIFQILASEFLKINWSPLNWIDTQQNYLNSNLKGSEDGVNTELVPKFHVALYASHAALRKVTLKILPCTNVTLILTLGWITLFRGDMGERALH
jgi:hypothetical protein